jgi:hypothetical protein
MVKKILMVYTCPWIADSAIKPVVLSSQKELHKERRFSGYFLSHRLNLAEEEEDCVAIALRKYRKSSHLLHILTVRS